MSEVITELGIDPAPPLVGFIWSEKAVKANGVPVDALLAAAYEANDLLGKSDEAWVRLRPLVKPANDAEFASIIAAFRAGITAPWSAADTQGAEKLTNLLLELGDMELVGDGTRFDPDLFYSKAG
jgi:NitT/TauT family transport system substrate-binding protein